MNKVNGFLYGLLSSASFGLIPLFAVPVMQQGMDFWSVLCYRFVFAALALAGILLLNRQSFAIRAKEWLPLTGLALLYVGSALFLLWGYKYMASGVATTLHFMYPVMTTLIMMLFFGERKSPWRILAILLATGGVFLLSQSEGGGTEESASLFAIFIVLISALCYALYLVAVSQLKTLQMKGLKMAFYVFFLGSIMLWAGVSLFGNIAPITNNTELGNLVMLALVPTVVSNLALVRAIKSIGSTLTSVLGAMEPVTAVAVGVLIFNEPLSTVAALGIGLIIAAVTVIILKPLR